ncbi:transcription factor JunD-like [Cololabis saira]|uniref:transcription factor JunD-like n=1 Tax=Cololabis saira TaxID=129043 RepID=UPI002AD33224|nr:transcription factor JunD-like [Cololabis saira]
MTARMETPFYHDDSPAAPGFGHAPDYERYPGNKMLMGKKAVPGGHPFPGGGGTAPGGRSGNHLAPAGVTSSSSTEMLKLPPTDMEHLIFQSGQGLVNAGNPFLYRGQATNEQEGFADGFVKALADLHKQNQLVGGGPMSPSGGGTYQRNLISGGDVPVYTNLGSYQEPYSGGPVGFGVGVNRGPDAPQTVPEAPHHPGDRPASPADPDEAQERVKAERKKLRNRIAASKCRRRKLERIARLEEKVRALKGRNGELAATAAALREQVGQLKRRVMGHVSGGCRISPAAKSRGEGAASTGAESIG